MNGIVPKAWRTAMANAVLHTFLRPRTVVNGIPLSSQAVAVLHALWDIREAAQEESEGGDQVNAGKVFDIRGDAVTRAFERAVSRARKSYVQECKSNKQRPDDRFLTDLRFHDLRHEATSRLASIFPMHEQTKITGHKELAKRLA